MAQSSWWQQKPSLTNCFVKFQSKNKNKLMKERKLIKRAGKVLKSKMCTVVSGAGQVQSRPSSVVVAYFPAILAGPVCTRMESRPRLGLPHRCNGTRPWYKPNSGLLLSKLYFTLGKHMQPPHGLVHV